MVRISVFVSFITKGDRHNLYIISAFTDTFKVSVRPFEIGSHTGYISRENKETLAKLHKFCYKDIKLKQFKRNLSSVTVMCSYYIQGVSKKRGIRGLVL